MTVLEKVLQRRELDQQLSLLCTFPLVRPCRTTLPFAETGNRFRLVRGKEVFREYLFRLSSSPSGIGISCVLVQRIAPHSRKLPVFSGSIHPGIKDTAPSLDLGSRLQIICRVHSKVPSSSERKHSNAARVYWIRTGRHRNCEAQAETASEKVGKF